MKTEPPPKLEDDPKLAAAVEAAAVALQKSLNTPVIRAAAAQTARVIRRDVAAWRARSIWQPVPRRRGDRRMCAGRPASGRRVRASSGSSDDPDEPPPPLGGLRLIRSAA